MKSFWDGCIPLSTMTMHTDRLMQLYRPPADAAEPAPVTALYRRPAGQTTGGRPRRHIRRTVAHETGRRSTAPCQPDHHPAR